MSKNEFSIRAYKAKELAAFYGLSKYIFLKKLKSFEDEIGKRIGQYYTPKQVGIIVSKLGAPETGTSETIKNVKKD